MLLAAAPKRSAAFDQKHTARPAESTPERSRYGFGSVRCSVRRGATVAFRLNGRERSYEIFVGKSFTRKLAASRKAVLVEI